MGLDREKTCLRCLLTTKTQTSHLISTFVIHLLESIISKLATCKFSIFKLVSVAEKTGSSLALTETLMTDFLAKRPIFLGPGR